jgi:hypothetical protein
MLTADETITLLHAEIDTLRRRIRQLEAERGLCADSRTLHPECRVWLVMNEMLKTRTRVRRDGR